MLLFLLGFLVFCLLIFIEHLLVFIGQQQQQLNT